MKKHPTDTLAVDTDALLAQWHAREAELRALPREHGIASPDQVAGMTGLQMLEAMRDGELPLAPIFDTLDFLMVEVEHGRAVFQGRPLARHYNPMGGAHGGWFATLLDSAVACAVHSTLGVGRSYTTAELKINIVRPLNDKVPLVRAEGKVIHVGRRMATADGRMVGPDGKLYAHASTTCFIFDTP